MTIPTITTCFRILSGKCVTFCFSSSYLNLLICFVDQSALNYQKQILQWQQAVAHRAPQAPSLYSSPFVHRGYYGDYRQDAAPTASEPAAPAPEVLPPQPTIVAPLPPGPPDTPPPPPQPLPEVLSYLL